MRKKRRDPKSFDHTHTCPVCGYKIPPAEMIRVDGTNILCPKCGEETPYFTHKPITTS